MGNNLQRLRVLERLFVKMVSRKVKKKNSVSFYQVEALGKDGKSPCEGIPSRDAGFEIEGEIEDHIIISVPPSMSERAAQEMLKKLSETISSPVIVITHNIEFLKARKLGYNEFMELSKRKESTLSDNIESEDDPMGREPAKVFGEK